MDNQDWQKLYFEQINRKLDLLESRTRNLEIYKSQVIGFSIGVSALANVVFLGLKYYMSLYK